MWISTTHVASVSSRYSAKTARRRQATTPSHSLPGNVRNERSSKLLYRSLSNRTPHQLLRPIPAYRHHPLLPPKKTLPQQKHRTYHCCLLIQKRHPQQARPCQQLTPQVPRPHPLLPSQPQMPRSAPKQLRSVVLAILPASRNANALLNNKLLLAPTTCLALLEPPPFENS